MMKQLVLSFMLVVGLTTSFTVRAQTPEENAQAAFENCTWASYDIGMYTNNMMNAYQGVIDACNSRIENAVSLGLTTAQVVDVIVIRDAADAAMDAFNVRWHTAKSGNPSGIDERYRELDAWEYDSPCLSDYQYMWAWYSMGGDGMWEAGWYDMDILYELQDMCYEFAEAAYIQCFGMIMQYMYDCSSVGDEMELLQSQVNAIF
jgi:hypothetical protein